MQVSDRKGNVSVFLAIALTDFVQAFDNLAREVPGGLACE